MSTDITCQILVVDDREGDANVLTSAIKALGVDSAKSLRPDDVTRKDLIEADLVLVDYKLDDWPLRDALGEQISVQPNDGIALLAVLRSHVAQSDRQSPTAFALYSGQLSLLSSPLPPDNRCHMLARLTGAEWVFSKTESDLAARAISLARAVKQLPQNWSNTDDDLIRLLGLVKLRTSSELPLQRTLEDVAQCLPPVHELATWSHGLAFIRWLLHRIFPYPCFLWGPMQLAARLQIDPAMLSDVLRDESPFREAFKAAEYSGILSDFAHPKWWRSLVEVILWNATNGKSFDDELVRTFIARLVDTGSLAREPVKFPVVIVNTNFEATGVSPADSAVRIRPDDWPAYAEQAWVLPDLASSDPRIKSVVIAEDLGKINA